MNRTFKYRLYSNKETIDKSENWLRLCRDLYNTALEQKIGYWKQNHERLSTYEQMNQLPELKLSFPEYKQVNAQTLQNVIERLDNAYIKFFQKIKQGEKKGFPRFKGENRYDSFTLKSQCGWELDGKYLKISKIGRFKIKISRPIQGSIKQITIKRTPTNKWYAYFICDNVIPKSFPETKKEVGIDVGIKSFAVDSDKLYIDNPLYFQQSENKLRRQQRKLSRRQLRSNNWQKARLQVAKTYEKITNQRYDYLHKLANYYIDRYGVIYIEDLDIRNIMRSNNILSKSILDSSWGVFSKLLTEKAEEAGRTVFRVPTKFTSQICSRCGKLVPKDVHSRKHSCPYCGLEIDRDYNSAINILRRGHRLLAETENSEFRRSQKILQKEMSRYAARNFQESEELC